MTITCNSVYSLEQSATCRSSARLGWRTGTSLELGSSSADALLMCSRRLHCRSGSAPATDFVLLQQTAA